jgi:phage head maturation protease
LRSANLDDLVATVDHAGVPIGRYPTTLDIEDRTDGLHWSVVAPESRSDVREAIERGDLKAGSWRMVVGRNEWRGDVRHVHEIAVLRDVSVVSHPPVRLHRAGLEPRQQLPGQHVQDRPPEDQDDDKDGHRARDLRDELQRGHWPHIIPKPCVECMRAPGVAWRGFGG